MCAGNSSRCTESNSGNFSHLGDCQTNCEPKYTCNAASLRCNVDPVGSFVHLAGCETFCACKATGCSGHGKCMTNGLCSCTDGYTGERCDISPCARPYLNRTDWWRAVTNGPSSDPHVRKEAGDVPLNYSCSAVSANYRTTGVGGNRWYRFLGTGGELCLSFSPNELSVAYR